MNKVNDLASDVGERSDARMHFRTKPRIKATIHKAAALSGLDDSSFAINAAYRAALDTIARHERTLLRAEDHAAFFCALEAAAEPTDSLRMALQRYNARSFSK